MINIDVELLQSIIIRAQGAVMNAKRREYTTVCAPFMATEMDERQINTPLRVAHFLAQAMQECDAFNTMEEYASGEEYEGRTDLGNHHMGDGKKYKGRGLIQTTGFINYRRAGLALGLDLEQHPELLLEPKHAVAASCLFWEDHRCNVQADIDSLLGVTHIINGGTNGLEQRRRYLTAAKLLVTARFASPLATTGETVVFRGTTGAVVGGLQGLLSRIGYPVAQDGEFGPQTELAVRMFQGTCNLKVDGIVGPATWKALTGALDETRAKGPLV